MKKHIQNERGAVFLVSVALIAVIASAISSVSLVALVRTDHFQAQFQHDAIQEELLLRSESKRTQMSIEFERI
ncbi:MAG: hypothetical protein H8E57_07135 [Candidatus Cloacimonetes bacterium]|nr:hypothetical protein [Candidatus Cloacimonadota bacterium]